MLNMKEIRELIKVIDDSSIDEFTYEHEGFKLNLKKNKQEQVTYQAAPQVVSPPQPVLHQENAPVQDVEKVTEAANVSEQTDENLHKITSPMVGTFYAAPSPDAEPYVKVGSKVTKDTVVCIVEAMKLFNEIEADVDGEIVEILVTNGQLVEFGQPLFLVKKA